MAQTSNVNYTPWNRVQDNFPIVLFIVLSFAFLLFLFFLDRIVVTVPAGHGGVLYRRLFGGTITDRVYGEGLQLVFPWDYMTVYDARLQEVKQEVKVLSQNGLTISLTVSVRYRPIYEKLGKLHKSIGPEYLKKAIQPVTIASVREVIGKYRPEELYTSHREQIQDEMLIEAIEKNGAHPILFEDIIIRTLMLPDLINEAIESKLKHEQLFLEYEFRLQREAQEAKRKLIEARGRERFQKTISPSLKPEYLQWRGIQATLKLAESPNTKIIVIGGGKDGLPIILNTETDKTAGGSAAPAEKALSLPGEQQAGQMPLEASQKTPGSSEGISAEITDEAASAVQSSPDQTHHPAETF
ncbi:MAG: prohibitin family protein [SAR324 cluster bacterium]|nr:prohibitin family protein [SAR324 cluster bacterium]